MKRLLLIAASIGLVALAIPAMASAATGDVQRFESAVTTDTQLGEMSVLFVFDDGDKLFFSGEVECRVEDTWGVIMKAIGPINPQTQSGSEDFQEFGDDQEDFDNEALGFGGPGSGNQGPVEQPCSEQETDFDLILEKLGTSDDFEETGPGGPFYGVWALAAESPTQQADPAFLGDAEVFFDRAVVSQRD
jgi:hypothetical protein